MSTFSQRRSVHKILKSTLFSVSFGALTYGGIKTFTNFLNKKTAIDLAGGDLENEKNRLRAFQFLKQRTDFDDENLGDHETMNRWFCKIDEKRKDAVKFARGRVLEVGCGRGRNLKFLGKNKRVTFLTSVDLFENLLDDHHKIAKLFKFPIDLEILKCDAQNLPFAENSFDTVLSIFSLCSFDDPVAAFSEMVRVSKSRIVLLEHGRSKNFFIRKFLEIFTLLPIQSNLLSFGCFLDRDIEKIIKKFEMKILVEKSYFFGLGKIYVLETTEKAKFLSLQKRGKKICENFRIFKKGDDFEDFLKVLEIYEKNKKLNDENLRRKFHANGEI